MADLFEIVAYLDQKLRTSEIQDYSGAMNGLHLANDGSVSHVIAAVDSSLPVIRAAAKKGPNGLLIVHHGMFWQGARPLTGAFYQKIKTAMEAGMAIYSSHLPLDVHPEHGNNAILARLIGIEDPRPALLQNGLHIGLKGTWRGERDDLARRIAKVVGGQAHLCPAGSESVQSVALCTGAAGSLVEYAAATGADTFVTGEGPHWSYPLAEELGINLLYAGHYLTEVFGVQSIAHKIGEIFQLSTSFVDHPTGL
jgi:dinuclear metal center YbgI/SA1388 family protein